MTAIARSAPRLPSRPRPAAPDRRVSLWIAPHRRIRLRLLAGAALAAGGCAEIEGLSASLGETLAPEPGSSAEILSPGPRRGGPEAERGSALLAAGHAAAAERAFSVSLATEGPSAQALVGLGAANRALGRAAAARDLLERAVTLWPEDVSARNAFGAVLYDDAEFAAARAQFDAALALLPPQDEAARLEVVRNIAFTDAALETRRAARDARDAAVEPASGPIVRPLGGGRWRIDPPKGS